MDLIALKVSSDPGSAGLKNKLPLRFPQTFLPSFISLPLRSPQTLIRKSQVYIIP
jgi:hypothetical protein